MISVEEYLDQVTAGVTKLPAVELPLEQAAGCILAEDLVAKLAVPPFTNSAMDGFAVKAADVEGASADSPVTLKIFEDVAAGASSDNELQPGYATRIMTGAPIPPGADAVVKVEDTNILPGPQELPDEVTIFAGLKPGKNIRKAGGNVQAGEVVVEAGAIVTPQVMSAAASIGYNTLPVIRRPRVGVIATGTELVDPGQPLEPGKIPDSNSILIAGLVRSFGAEVVYQGRSGDTPDCLAEMYRDAAREADLIITSGGVSAGAFDVVKELGMTAGFKFETVRMQPGKPQGHGEIDVDGRKVKVVSLPGNPVSVYVSFILYVRPVLSLLAGFGRGDLQGIPAVAGTDWKSTKGRRQYAPMIAKFTDEGVKVYPTHSSSSGSHLIATLHRATGLVRVASEVDEVKAGDAVVYYPM
ncbi:MAG: molybdopterin molybdotransferase MoeA [Actinomycetaceae bacterium]|nr:molybdopterin molybdotransferase MoeA [Actinomycetaceae bacterium]